MKSKPSQKMLQEIGKRCNVRGLDLLKCDPRLIDVPGVRPREFAIIGIEGKKFILQNRFNQTCIW